MTNIMQMNGIMEKLTILSDAAKYDVACTSSGVHRGGDGKNAGNTVKMEYKWLRLWAYSECSGGCSFKNYKN